MAKFEVLDQEGTHFVQITLDNETVQAEAGALCLMTGNITMDIKLPSLGRALTSYLSEEAKVRPAYTGTGTIAARHCWLGGACRRFQRSYRSGADAARQLGLLAKQPIAPIGH